MLLLVTMFRNYRNKVCLCVVDTHVHQAAVLFALTVVGIGDQLVQMKRSGTIPLSFISVLSTAAVMGCAGGFQLSLR
jgi:hypothetical protein